MTKEKILGELVTFKNSSGLYLDGILYQKDDNPTTVIHVHGSFGNFYANRWLRVMAGIYVKSGINFLAFNLTGHDGLAEAYRFRGEGLEDKFEYIGFSVTNFEECINDIQGAIDFAEQFSQRIILQGHSLGCDRVLYYILTKNIKKDLILIGPADSYQLQSNRIKPENIDHQIVRLKQATPNDTKSSYDWLAFQEYGISQPPEEIYNIPITRNALLSILQGPPFQLIRLSHPASFWLDQKALIYLGGNDSFQTWSPDEMFRYFEEHIRDVTRIYKPQSNHELGGCEAEVTNKIVHWIQNI